MPSRHSGVLQRAWIRARTSSSAAKLKYLTIVGVLLFNFYYGFRVYHRKEPFFLPVEQACVDEKRPRPAEPLIVLIAGGSRSGTTYLYNLIRILLRQRDPNTISGWYEDLGYATRYASPNPPSKDREFGSGFLDAYNSTGTTVLVKVHTLAHAIRLFSGCDGPRDLQDRSCPVDLVFVTHRDLPAQVNSLRRMGWGRERSTREMSDPYEYCRAIKVSAPRLVDKDWESPETWKSQAKPIAMCHEQWISAAGHKLAVDMSMETSLAAGVEERVKLADRIVRSMPTKDHAKMDSAAAVAEADALRPLDCASWLAVNPITHLHRGHVASNASTDKQDELIRKRGYKVIEEDSYLARWRKTYGYA